MKLLALMGKAGSGKDAISKELCSLYPDFFTPVVSYTTRPRREGEVDGIDYHFVTPKDFKELPNMLESCCFNNWYYGSSTIGMSKDKVNIGIFTPEGIRQLSKYPDIEFKVFYVRAGDKTRLLR